ncbi:MAG: hypothetical protein DDT20_01040 [Firmicutes bacterium]|nr:hypothetical protein [Bacillota bacterium]
MSQVSSLTGPQSRPLFRAENTAAQVIPAAGDTILLTMSLGGIIQNLAVALTVGVNALDAFIVEAQFHPNGGWVMLTNAVTATPAGLILAASGTLASQPVGTGWFIMNARGLQGVRVSASGTVNDLTTVLVRASGS